MTSGRDYSWLPEHQLDVAWTLAHADDLIARAGDVLFDYVKPPGPLRLQTVPDGRLAHVTVAAVAPLPAAVARFAADALTQLRAALEHTLYAEVEHELGRGLDADEARRVEMPASVDAEGFAGWLRGRRRRDHPPLREGSPLVKRIRELQPYQRRDGDNHPLRVLAEHTNLAKHRTPAVAATLLGAVIPDAPHAELRLAGVDFGTDGDRPIRPGDMLASAPQHTYVPLSIWPKVSIQRPHTGTWHVFMTELGDLEEWVRTVAVPHLIIGRHDVDPLPPQLDTKVGYYDVRTALAAAGVVAARERSTRRIQAGAVRVGLVEIVALHSSRPDVELLQTWVDMLDDGAVLERHDRLVAARFDRRRLAAVLRQLLTEAAAVNSGKSP